MFNTSQEISLHIPSPDGDKNVVVRFPSDDEWAERMSRSKTVVKPLGRGKTVSEIQNPERVNADLFGKIKVSGDDLDEFEASKVIDRLSRCEVVDCVRDGSEFTVTLKVPGAKTTHVVRMPSAKQVMNYRRAVVSIVDGRRGYQEIKMNLHPAGDLYDTLCNKFEGYASEVPVIHKSVVIGEVLAAIDGDDDDEDIEGF